MFSKIYRRLRYGRDSGYSLVEVLIALAILGVAGAVLLSSLTSGALNAKTVVGKQAAYLALSSGSEIVSQTKFITCNENTSGGNPYSSVTLPAGVSITSVKGFVSQATGSVGAGSWVDCSSWPTNLRSALMQQIVLSITDKFGTTTTRTITKTFASQASEYGASGLFSVVPIAAVGMFSGSSVSVTPTTQNTPANAYLIFFILPGSSGNLTVAQSGSTFTLTALSTFSGKANIEIGAFDVRSSTYAIPTTLQVSVFPPLSLAGATLATELGATKFFVGALSGGTVSSTVTLTASGGSGSAITFSTATTGIAITSSGDLTLSSTSGWSTGSKTLAITLTSGGASSVANQSLTVAPALTYSTGNTYTLTGASPLCVTTTGSLKVCTFTFYTTANTGLGNSSPGVTAASTMANASLTTTWDSVNSRWKTVLVTNALDFSTASRKTCNTSGATLVSGNFTFTDPLLGALASQPIKVTC